MSAEMTRCNRRYYAWGGIVNGSRCHMKACSDPSGERVSDSDERKARSEDCRSGWIIWRESSYSGLSLSLI